MRKVCSQPFALGMSLLLLVTLAVCGIITKTTPPSGSNQNPWRAICAPQHPVCAPVIAGIGGSLLLLAARDRADLAQFAETAADEADPALGAVAATAPDVTEASIAHTLIAGIACLWWALLYTCVAPRRTGMPLRRAARRLPLRRITEHRVAPAP
jgi:hypothetical protein